MKKWLFLLLLGLVLSFHSTSMAREKDVSGISIALQDPLEVTGQITDTLGAPLPGVTIRLRPGIETTTDQNGRYVLAIPNEFVKDAVLTFSMVGFTQQQITVAGQTKIDVRLAEASNLIGETVVTAFGQRARKEDVVGAITTVNPSDLKIPSSNLTTALAGRVAGVIGFQRSGEPGADNADFFIRGVTTFGYKVDPLILIDNVESTTTDLARMQVDDIESFSILKDASAAALYGARGANGVILITTKVGRRETLSVSFRLENSLSTATRNVEMVDPITYMKLANEATVGRDPLTRGDYSQRQIEFTPPGGSLEYPAVDWQKELLNNYAMNQRANLSVRGGGSIAQYYVSGAFNQDNGILKVPQVSNFNSNVNLKTYSLLSNVNINLTEKTQLIVRLSGTFDDYIGPLQSATKAYRDIMRAVPTRFQPYYEPGENYKYLNHIMFGNADEGRFLNPYAEMVKGYREYSQSRMQAQLELNQKLDVVTEGLSFTGRVTTKRYAYYQIGRSYVPFTYEYSGADNNGNNLYTLHNQDTGRETLEYDVNLGRKDVTSIFFLQGIANYQRKFGEHSVTGLLVGTMNSELAGNTGSLQLSLPHRNLGVAGKFTYGYLGKYHVEANFGYNGSERFSEEYRYGFFPSVGVAWHVSKENFFESMQPVISNLRLRGTYGLVGNDAIGAPDQRFYYMSEIVAGPGWVFGPAQDESLAGVAVRRYPNPNITWETAYKSNVALELGLFNNAVEIQADWFTEQRKNIFMPRADIPATMGLAASIYANMGEARGSGIDMSASYKKSFYNGLWIQGMANFTYATSKFEVYEEPPYEYPWLYRAGYPINIARGYIAERLFIDDQEVRNSPEQQLGGSVSGKPAMAGDIKYVDVNGDGKITSLDQVPLGYPTVPEINYGFGISLGYKGFDFNIFFQGLARESFFIDPAATGPFRRYIYDQETVAGDIQNNVLQVYADSHWSQENRDVYALFPRLSSQAGNPNNEVTSTWWMRNGEFLRLKQLTVGYTFEKKETGLLKRIGLGSLRVYGDGLNLLTFSRFKLWDVEMAGNGLGYPIQRVINVGVKMDF
ncbi:SusC/RagA family TonB-linked outer membrane protein [Sphingobacterium pedocola]|uniref:SusC/RagA family TonB-linked outer membrane protein n=1 Tax=Sphingobacterium pedocola TaxID=2082722 RepID=A0ABR9TBM5_9SPHI|nr:TonB-dependent receptor [Sphingobacterium pedocola]MBE8722760.1 SusC/RagA family TonB-linked outer membrane protein [Sphingobacterium pedocola]